MPIPRTEMSRRLMRWMLPQTAPAPLPLEHPSQQDMAEAADMIDTLTRGSRAALASIHTRIGQIEKAFKPFNANSYYQIDVAVGQLRDAANILNNVLTARMLGPPQPDCLMAAVNNEPCAPTASNLKRCLVCGFIIDTTYEAEQPTVRNRIGGGD